ncbi:cell division topological specificity factor MinE [Zhaonella formicivorans]|uniref:cell division topological specificity factor MinE n=1 Tax=Zhaonella formicivorans TaxID=2528593 RepID=UPI0010D71CFD|nr:cell division topological specificity factor MinE [Zhaonella formicivorans]
MLEFLQRVFGRDTASASKKVAKERLRLVLVHDRADMSPQILQSLKEDLIRVISEYMEIDRNNLEVSFANESDSVALVCNIPVLRVKRTAGSQIASSR